MCGSVVECLPDKFKVLGSIPAPFLPSKKTCFQCEEFATAAMAFVEVVMAHVFYPQHSETGGPEVGPA